MKTAEDDEDETRSACSIVAEALNMEGVLKDDGTPWTEADIEEIYHRTSRVLKGMGVKDLASLLGKTK